jgi:hypothetical protein
MKIYLNVTCTETFCSIADTDCSVSCEAVASEDAVKAKKGGKDLLKLPVHTS